MFKYLCLLPLSLCISAGALAQTVTGELNLVDNGILTWKSDNLKYDDQRPYSANTQYLVCMDRLTTSYGLGGTFSFVANPGTSVFLAVPNPGQKGIAAIHWLFDNYYEKHTASDLTFYEMRSFQYALWELSDDYDGTIDSIDPDKGNVRANDDPESNFYPPEFHTALATIHADMRVSLESLPPTYRSQKYDISFLKATDPTHQSLIAFNVKNTPPLPPTTTPVPSLGEWSVISLTLGVGLFGFIRLRKKHQS